MKSESHTSDKVQRTPSKDKSIDGNQRPEQQMLKDPSTSKHSKAMTPKSQTTIQDEGDYEAEILGMVSQFQELQLTFKKLEEDETNINVSSYDRKSKKSSKYSQSITSVQEKMRFKIKLKGNKHLGKIIDKFDELNRKMVTYLENDEKDKLQFLSQQTIMNCSNAI